MQKGKYKYVERCAICGPNNTSTQISHICFPKDKWYYSIWEQFCEETVDVLFASSKLCCIHFTSDSFSAVNKLHRLKKDAVPTLYPKGLDNSSKRRCFHSVPKNDHTVAVTASVNTKLKFTSKQYCFICKKTTTGLSHFRFPADEIRKFLWAEFCGIDVSAITTNTKLCQHHFTKDDFTFGKDGIVHLKQFTVPSIGCKVNENNHQRMQFCLCCKKLSIGIIHFKFPKDLQYRSLWAAFCNIDISSVRDCMKLCIHHFSTHTYSLENDTITIKSDAIPSILHAETMVILDEQSFPEIIEDEKCIRPCSLCGDVLNKTVNFKFNRDPQIHYLLKKIYGIADSLINTTEVACVVHFDADDFIYNEDGSNNILREGAMPVVYLEEMRLRCSTKHGS